jgi:hypothetical protein
MKKKLALIFCAIFLMGCGNPNYPLIENHIKPSEVPVNIDVSKFPSGTVHNSTNRYALIEFNGDKLAGLWEKANTGVKYVMYAAAIVFTTSTAIYQFLRILAFVGLIKNHDQNLLRIDPANNSVKLAAGGTVTVSGGQITGGVTIKKDK